MNDLFDSFSKFDKTVSKEIKKYSGLLGLTPDKNSAVEVPNRNGYIYVRFRDNQSEVIQAYNDKVSPANNLPVLVARQANRWIVLGRDIDRYENWGTYAPFLPEHGFQHEFPRDNPGGDIVFSYVDQIMPLNVFPSGSPGSPNVLMAGYSYKKSDDSWAYVGETGTQSLLLYVPTDNQARVILVYLDRDTGNPGILVNSGTALAANLTGTHDILQYLPPNTALQEPVKAVRLVSGTTYIGWDNLYDVRQFFSRDITGSGGSTPTFNANRVVITDDFGNQTVDPHFYFDYGSNILIVGADSVPLTTTNMVNIVGSGTSPSWNLWAYGSNVRGLAAFERAGGTQDNPTAVQDGWPLGRVAWRGYDGADVNSFGTTRAQIEARALGNFVSGSNAGTEIVFSITPTGTVSLVDFLTLDENGLDILYGTYNISGSPHVHYAIDTLGTHGLGYQVPASTTEYTAPFKGVIDGSAQQTNWPVGGVLKNLTFACGSQPATGSLVVTVYVNGNPTTLVATCAAGDSGTFQDTTHEVIISGGYGIRFNITNNATSNGASLGAITVALETPVTT